MAMAFIRKRLNDGETFSVPSLGIEFSKDKGVKIVKQ